MIAFFTSLSTMLKESWWIALISSFIWGIISVILSPCHLASIPLIVGFINDRERTTKTRAALLYTLFTTGILITLGIIGFITGLLGRILGDTGGIGNYIVGVFLLIFGIYMMDIIQLPFLENGVKPTIKKREHSLPFLWALYSVLLWGHALLPL